MVKKTAKKRGRKEFPTYRHYAVLPERFYKLSPKFGQKVKTYLVRRSDGEAIMAEGMTEIEAHKTARQLEKSHHA